LLGFVWVSLLLSIYEAAGDGGFIFFSRAPREIWQLR